MVVTLNVLRMSRFIKSPRVLHISTSRFLQVLLLMPVNDGSLPMNLAQRTVGRLKIPCGRNLAADRGFSR